MKRFLLAIIGITGLCLSLGVHAAGGARVEAVASVVIPVSDMDRSIAFYRDVLSFRMEGDREELGDACEHYFGVFGARLRVARLRLGDEHVELLQFLTPRGRPLPADLRPNDRAFQHIAIIVSDMDQAFAWLQEHHVEYASSAPQKLPAWNHNAGGISAFYFRDPDGNYLEILHFPPGKGAARWQSRDALFLGIDHTAIVVANTEASLHYYRDLLGLVVAGESENYGTEQEHLNGVFGARLRITALRAPQGPGIELLEYLAPRTGRPIPDDSRANDHWYWQVNFLAWQPQSLFAAVATLPGVLVSGAVVDLESPLLGIGSGFVLRDPDGHAASIASAAGRP